MAVPALMWIGWQAAGEGGGRVGGAAAGFAASLGFFGYCAYNYAVTGDWFE